MPDYQTLDINDSFEILIDDSPEKTKLSDAIRGEIERIWQEEVVSTQGRIYNGKLFSLHQKGKGKLIGHFVEYKHYLAQLRGLSLGIQPLTISAITRYQDLILFGQRSEKVTQYQLMYELVPSGGVDSRCVVNSHLNILEQFRLELLEETGISRENIQAIHPFALVCDDGLNEICAEIELNEAQELAPTEEYLNFHWVAKEKVAHFIAEKELQILPLSHYLLQKKGYLL